MKIIISENQLKTIITEESNITNFKPAVHFDEIYGTNLAQKYDLSPLNEKMVWKRWLKCRNDDCDDLYKLFRYLPKIFPYVDYEKVDGEVMFNILMGVVSEFNKEDVIYFSVKKIPYFKNEPQKELEKQLPAGVLKNINWVLSPRTIKIIKKRFSIE